MDDFNNTLILKYKVEVESVKQLLEVQEQAVYIQSLLLEEKIDELRQTVKRLNDEIAMRKTAEAHLQESELRFRGSLEKLRLIAVQLDKKGDIVFCNDYLLQLTAYQRDEVLGRQWVDLFIPPEYRNKIRGIFKGLIEEANVQEYVYYENAILTRAGEARIVRWNNTLFCSPDGIPIGISSIGEDVTKQKKAESELQAAYIKLKETQKQLVQSAKMASIGMLAGGVAHEINNPLTGVLNNVQLIRVLAEANKEFSLKEFKELLDIIEESAARCKKITQSLLDFSHISKGEFRMFSFNEAIEKVIMLIEQELKLQNIAIQKEFTADIPLVLGDPQTIQQAILDLINNAKWAIQQKPGKEAGLIILRTEYEAEKKTVCFSISDNGVGIAKENLDKIFEPFFTTKQIGEGTGLGLSMVYNIVNVHQGTIGVESEVDRGTTFKIRLPAPSTRR